MDRVSSASRPPVIYWGAVPSVIENIRTRQDEPTLETIPQLNRAAVRKQPMGHMIRQMQDTGVHRWGFVIYRCAYSDQAQWEQYIHFLKLEVREALAHLELEGLLLKYLQWTVIEDANTFDGATKPQVREAFCQWVDQSRQDRDWPEDLDPLVMEMPRFNYCVSIDQKCLDTLDRNDLAMSTNQPWRPRVVACAILDRNFGPEGSKGEYPAVEGCTQYYPGWMYTEVGCLPEQYHKLCHQSLTNGFKEYARPPLVYPGQETPLE